MSRLSFLVFYLCCTLMPTYVANGSSDQQYFEGQQKNPFLTLTKLELDHDFWSRILDTSSSTNTLLDSFYAGKVDACYSAFWLTESDCDRLLEAMKLGFTHITKDIVPERFWEEQLAVFYSSVLTQDDAQSYVVSYKNMAGTPAEAQLVKFRVTFVREVLPRLVPQIRSMAQAFKVPNGGMAPSLLAGDYFIVNKLAYQDHGPGRGDMIVFRYPEDESKIFVKRIIAVPKDQLEIRDKVVYLNGEALREDNYIQHVDTKIFEKAVNPRDNLGPLTVPENSYFVMGDNREESLDSRFWGFLKQDKIIGKVSMIYWSWDDAAIIARWDRAGRRMR